MKSLSVCLLLLFVFSTPGFAQFPQIRPLDDLAADALDRGQRSARFRELVAEVTASDLIVHVVSVQFLPFGTLATTRFVGPRGGWRYLRVELAATLKPDRRAATLGHELHHALEIARAGVQTQDEMRQLYRTIGRRIGGYDLFETEDALDAGMDVWLELTGAVQARRHSDGRLAREASRLR